MAKFFIFLGFLVLIGTMIYMILKTIVDERRAKKKIIEQVSKLEIGDVLLLETQARNPWDEAKTIRVYIDDIKNGWCLYRYVNNETGKPYKNSTSHADTIERMLSIYVIEKKS